MTGEPTGVLVVDKPTGPTSHDVVGKMRRALGTRRVGHAGTLDPMASGVLVVLVGEATKLAAYLTAHDKRYTARVALGVETDTLDRQGTAVRTAEVPRALLDEIAALAAGASLGETPQLGAALAGELARRAQVPPVYSAIQIGGRRSYDLARAGEAVDLDERSVTLTSATVVGAGLPAAPELPFVEIDLRASKGYYVRSFARDLGERLGVPAHLAALRRTESGPFTASAATPVDAPREVLLAALRPLAAAARDALPIGLLTDLGAVRARQGKRLSLDDFTLAPPPGEASAWLDAGEQLVALGGRVASVDPGSPDEFVIHRGFAAT